MADRTSAAICGSVISLLDAAKVPKKVIQRVWELFDGYAFSPYQSKIDNILKKYDICIVCGLVGKHSCWYAEETMNEQKKIVLGGRKESTLQELTNEELVQHIRENNKKLMRLLSYPSPTSDGAFRGYEGEVRALELDGDELLEEADCRGLDRKAALFGVIKKVRESNCADS